MNKQADYNKGYFVDDVFVESNTSYEDVVQILKQKDLKEFPYDFTTSFECYCNHIYIYPTKGSGGVYLEINQLNLEDKYNSKTLFKAFELLEKLLDEKLSYHEEYDC